MTIEIKKQEETPLLGRTNVEARIAFDGPTPSRRDIRKELAKKLKADEELIVVHSIHTQFGEGVAKIKAYAYKKKKDLEAIERKYMVERHAEKKTKEKPASEAAPAPAEGEAAAEEKKEEAKEEAKPEEAPKEEEKKEENSE